MTDYAAVRQRIVTSVFSRRNTAGGLEETYVAHIKIWEDAGPEGRKPRYILLSETSNGTGLVHKSKENSNGTFSIGKTWNLAEVRAIQVPNPSVLNITVSRTYTWYSENAADQANFVDALVRSFKKVTGGGASLYLEGIQDQDTSRAPEVSLSQPRPRYRGPAAQPDPPTTSSIQVREPTPLQIQPLPSKPQADSSSIRSRQDLRRAGPSASPSQIASINLPPATPRLLGAAERSRLDSSRSASRPSLESVSGRSYSPQPNSALTPGTPRVRPVSPSISNASREPSTHSKITTTSDAPLHRRGEQNDRVSFFDPANRAALDRLISGSSGAANEGEMEDETVQATMADVEEMLDGYELAAGDVASRRTSRGAADLIEARLLDELMAVEKANIYSFLESDERIGTVLKYLDESISELDNMEGLVSSYKIHLNAVNEDISYIQSQHRGLQVQTQNQRALLTELESLLQMVQVDGDSLTVLTQESLEKTASMQRLEEAAAQLYKALQAGRDRDMAATIERLNEYRTYNNQFCKRLFDFLSIAFIAQSKMLLGKNDGVVKSGGGGRPSIVNHEAMEVYLGRYAGLMLYLKEMDDSLYAKLCAAYFSAVSELHRKQIKAFLANCVNIVKKGSEDDQEPTFAISPTSTSFKTSGLRRAGTLIRSPTDVRDREKEKNTDRVFRASEVFGLVLEHAAPQIYREEEFIIKFLRVNDNAFSFADYMGLDNYFRRQAARRVGPSQTTVKLVRGAMDLIFGFFPTELKTWLDNALALDNMEVIGIVACLERFLVDADERGNAFLQGVLDKQHTRLKAFFDRHVNERIQAIEKNKLTSKKRQGAASFVKYFPIYVGRVENQLLGTDGLEIRASVDLAYERIVNSMFDCLKQMAKLDGESGDDKGQLNYHVILIENMHQFVADVAELSIGSMRTYIKQAEAIYEENLAAYVKIVLRRPFAKILDYIDGVERLLKTTAPTELASNSVYTPGALKRVVKEYSAKDVRKHVEALSKRVEKHFTEASEKETTQKSGIARGTVMVGVWKACETEVVKMTELFTKLISQCYGKSGVSLDYTVADVQAVFRNNRVGT